MSRSVSEEQREEEFVQLVTKHHVALRGFVGALMPGQQDIDDVVQEVTSLLWQKRSSYVMGSNFRAWMFTTARYKILGYWRDRQRRMEWAIPEATLLSLIDHAKADTYLLPDERLRFLRECLEHLRPDDRGLILRRYLDGIRVKDLAADVGRSAESLKVSLHRIRAALRQCISKKLKVSSLTQ